MDSSIYQSKDYNRSRKAYIAQCTFEYFISLMVTDAFLAKILTYIGLSDSLIGLISSFITFAFMFQIVTVILAQKIKNVKRGCMIFTTTSQLFFTCLYIIPLISLPKEVKAVFSAGFILIAYCSLYFITSVVYKWGNSFVQPDKRGYFSATKEMISLICGMIFTLVIGKVMDHFESLGKIEYAFTIFVCIMFICSLSNLISLLMIKKNESANEKKEEQPFRAILKSLFLNTNFRSILIFTILLDIVKYMTLGFLGTYKTKELMISVGTVQIINIVGSGFRFAFSRPLGRYSDRTSYVKGIKLSLYIAALAFFINIFTMPQTRWLIIVFTILNCISNAGTNANSINIIYSYVPSEHFVQASAIKNSVGGLFGFVVSIIASRIVAYIQGNNNIFLGLHIYAQQILSVISFLTSIILILFIKYKMENKKTMLQ